MLAGNHFVPRGSVRGQLTPGSSSKSPTEQCGRPLSDCSKGQAFKQSGVEVRTTMKDHDAR